MIYIDADACPVKTEAETVATRLGTKMYLVCNGGIRPSRNPYVELVIVPDGPDVADMWIADRAKTGDVVVTGDIPLAARVIENGARVIRHNGEALTDKNADPGQYRQCAGHPRSDDRPAGRRPLSPRRRAAIFENR